MSRLENLTERHLGLVYFDSGMAELAAKGKFTNQWPDLQIQLVSMVVPTFGKQKAVASVNVALDNSASFFIVAFWGQHATKVGVFPEKASRNTSQFYFKSCSKKHKRCSTMKIFMYNLRNLKNACY